MEEILWNVPAIWEQDRKHRESRYPISPQLSPQGVHSNFQMSAKAGIVLMELPIDLAMLAFSYSGHGRQLLSPIPTGKYRWVAYN